MGCLKMKLKIMEGASIKRRDEDTPLKSHMNQSPAQVGVMRWQKGVSHSEHRVRYNCGLYVSVLFSLSPCV